MVNNVVLGSIRHRPYEVLVPHPFDPKFFWVPGGVKPGSHMVKDRVRGEGGEENFFLQEMSRI